MCDSSCHNAITSLSKSLVTRSAITSDIFKNSFVDPPFIVFEDDCAIKNFQPEIEIPDDADAVYLGVSSWG